jgi:hypothetical protein
MLAPPKMAPELADRINADKGKTKAQLGPSPRHASLRVPAEVLAVDVGASPIAISRSIAP